MYRWGVVYVECHRDLNISKTTTDQERVVTKTEPDDGWNLERLEMVWICVEKTILNALGRDGLY